MATGWNSYQIEFNGGLVSNLSRLQHGVKAPGSARFLVNFEPSIKGGYRRINGFAKYDTAHVPLFGETKVQGSGQSGTTLLVANLFEAPVDGDSFTISGVTGTYTIDTGGVVYDSANKSATLTLTSALDSSPSDKADITWTNKNSTIEGLHHFYDSSANTGVTLVVRNGVLWSSTGGGWVNVSAPSYGSVQVNGAAQSGTSLALDGVTSDTYVPKVGDTFTIDGVELVYTVTAEPTITSGAGTVSIDPALDSSPADDAAITFISSSLSGASKVRFEDFNYGGTEKVILVDGVNSPKTYDLTDGLVTLDGSSDVNGSDIVASFKNHMFYAKGSLVTFSAPFLEDNLSSASGAGSIQLPSDVTGLIVFREKLIIFTLDSIHQLQGSSNSDFTLSVISDTIGCRETDSIKEVAGDIVYLGPDGLRFLGATDRIGDFNLSLASRNIQDDLTTFTSDYTDFCAITIRGKSQYRLFAFTSGAASITTKGFLGTQFVDQEAGGFSWAELKGFKAYRTASAYTDTQEVLLFSGEDGYVFQMETGNTLDGSAIEAFFYTPFIPVNDPRVRKTLYKCTTYYDPEGDVDGNLTFKYDFTQPDVVQPLSGGGSFSILGSAIYDTSVYGGDPSTVIETQATGSFFTVSLQYSFTELNTPPFVIDTAILEFAQNDRK